MPKTDAGDVFTTRGGARTCRWTLSRSAEPVLWMATTEPSNASRTCGDRGASWLGARPKGSYSPVADGHSGQDRALEVHDRIAHAAGQAPRGAPAGAAGRGSRGVAGRASAAPSFRGALELAVLDSLRRARGRVGLAGGRDVTRALAHCDAGKEASAGVLAQRFLERAPDSAYAVSLATPPNRATSPRLRCRPLPSSLASSRTSGSEPLTIRSLSRATRTSRRRCFSSPRARRAFGSS